MKLRNEIETQIVFDASIARIVYSTDVNRSQIDKMKRNLIKHDCVVASHAMRERFRKMSFEMKTHLLKYIDLHFIKYIDEMC